MEALHREGVNMAEESLDAQVMRYEQETILDRFMKSKLARLEESLLLINSLISEREKLHGDVMRDLEGEVTEARKALIQMEPLARPYMIDRLHALPVVEDIRKELRKLEVAKADETVRAWQDVMQLKRELIDFMRQCLEEKEKVLLLTGAEKWNQ